MDDLGSVAEMYAAVLGPIGGVVIAPTALVVLAVVTIRRSKWPLWVGLALTAVVAASTWVYWDIFWEQWAILDTEELPPARLDVQSDLALYAAGAASMSIVALAVVTTVRRFFETLSGESLARQSHGQRASA